MGMSGCSGLIGFVYGNLLTTVTLAPIVSLFPHVTEGTVPGGGTSQINDG
jgi:hypothetical protein